MRTIEQIESIERKVDKDGTPYYHTTALLSRDGESATGFSRDPHLYKVGMRVEAFWVEKWQMFKMQPSKKPVDNSNR